MAKSFFSRFSTEEDEEGGASAEAKFNESLTTKVTEAVAAATKESVDTVKSLKEIIEAQNKRFAKEDEDRARAQRAEAERNKKTPLTSEEQFELMATDPTAFVRSVTEPAAKLAFKTNAKLIRSEVLGQMPYYHGEFKNKVDSLIENSGDLVQQGTRDYILNCYKIVKADHMEEIAEGKLKQFHAMGGYSDAGGSGRSQETDAKIRVEYEDEKSKYAAKQLGITDDDLISAAKTRVIRGLEVVA